MASYSDIEKQAVDKAQKQSGDYANKSSQLSDSAKAEIQKLIDASTKNVQAQNAQSVSDTKSAYQNLVDLNKVDRIISQRNVEDALSKIGVSNPKLNASEELALNVSTGNANRNASVNRDAAVKALSNMLANYMTQSSVNNANANASFDNAMRGNALSNETNSYQNALSSAAKTYGASMDAETSAAEAQSKAQIQAMKESASAESKAIDNYYSNLKKLLNADKSYADATDILAGKEPQSEIDIRAEAERVAKQEAIPDAPNIIDKFLADYGNQKAVNKIQQYNNYNATKLQAPSKSPDTASWVDPDNSVKQYADNMRNAVNNGDVDTTSAIKSIIAYYGQSDPKLMTFNDNGQTIYAVNDQFINQQISYAMYMSGLSGLAKDYFTTNVGDGNGSWIIK